MSYYYFLKGKEKSISELTHTLEILSPREKWIFDGFRSIPWTDSLALIEIDFSKALNKFPKDKFPTITHLDIVARAAGLAAEKHRHFMKVSLGYKRYYPNKINISLSVASDNPYASTVILQDVNLKSCEKLSMEILGLAVQERKREEKEIKQLNTIGFFIPFPWIRSKIFHFLLSKRFYREKIAEVIQLTYLPDVDKVSGLKFLSTCLLSLGALRQRPVVCEGQIVARPTAWLSGTVDHTVWDGMCLNVFLNEIKKIIESEVESL